jgi:hypothetical protein
MKNAQAITGKMQEMRDRLGERRVTGSAGGGMVCIEMNGHSQVTACQIDPAIFQTADRELLEDLVVAAANQALEKVKQVAAEEMGQVTEGLNLPGLSDALSRLGLGDLNR